MHALFAVLLLVTPWVGVRPSANGRSLLVRIAGEGPSVDRVEIALPEKEFAEGAKAAYLPPGWTMTRRKARLELEGPPAPLPLHVRIELAPGKSFASAEVSAHAGKQRLHSAKVEVNALSPSDDKPVVVFPPLVTAGETIELAVMGPARTAGTWLLNGNAAVRTERGLSVRVPVDAAPLELTYVDPWGETTARIPLDFVRVVPAEAEAPSEARAGPCGVRTPIQLTCVCGWFPKREVVVDGVAVAPLAASQRSVCVQVEPGLHEIEGHQVTALGIRRTVDKVLSPGQTTLMTLTVTGTTDPVRLRLRNTSPGVATLQGGEVQTVVTSGGANNSVTRSITGISVGVFNVIAESERTSDDDGEYSRILDAVLRRELTRIAARLLSGFDSLPTDSRGTVRRDDVLGLLDRIEADLMRAAPFRELAAFRDAAAEQFERARAGIAALESPIMLIAQRSPRVKKEEARGFLAALAEVFSRSAAASKRKICITTETSTSVGVRIYPESFPSDDEKIDTNATLTLYLGKYVYEVTTEPYRRTGSVDLLDNIEPILRCRLADTSCSLVAETKGSCP